MRYDTLAMDGQRGDVVFYLDKMGDIHYETSEGDFTRKPQDMQAWPDAIACAKYKVYKELMPHFTWGIAPAIFVALAMWGYWRLYQNAGR